MKNLLFIGLLFVAGNVFCQHVKNVPLNAEQEKKVKALHKDINKQLKALVKNDKMSAEDKKSKVYELKAHRNTQLDKELLPEQIGTVLENDPIKWDHYIGQIDKVEATRLKAERDGKLKELDTQNSDIQKQLNDLKQKQKDLNKQLKTIKQQKKEIKAQYNF